MTFDEIVESIFDSEGGFVDNPNDRGGPTNLGITIHNMRRLSMDLDGDGDVDENDVTLLTKADAKKVYYEEYWVPSRAKLFPEGLRHIYFDMIVNFGIKGAVKVIQKTANAKGSNLKVDGVIGPKTLNAAQKLKVGRIRAYRVLRFAEIVFIHPEQEIFWYGWFNRANSV